MDTNSRNIAIDCQKGLLTLLMILCHCIQFFGQENRAVQGFLVNYINLTTFSGFFFCFGYVAYKAYFRKEFGYAAKRMLKNAGRLLIAFYLSEIAYYAFVDNKIYRTDLILDVMFIRKYAGWSEFLISFSAIMLIGILLFPVFKKMNCRIFLLFLMVSLAACFIPYAKQSIPQLALLIGSYNYVTYPCVQYLVYFAFGVLLAKKEWGFHIIIFGGCFLASMPVIGFYAQHNTLPMRFPPSWVYITGAFLFVYLYYLLCNRLVVLKETNAVVNRIVQYLCTVGGNSLFYLLISNLLIFAFAKSAFSFRDIKYVVVFYICLLLFVPYLQGLNRNRKVIQ
jgi:hypothetical protein